MSDFSNPTLYYRHSGKFPPLSPVVVLIAGGIGAAVLSIPYGYAIHYIPLVIINIVLPFIFGIVLAVILSVAGNAAKIRNSSVLTLTALFVVIAGRYFTLLTWIYAFSRQQVMAFSPGEIFAVLLHASREGIWEILGFTPRKSLWVIWSLETLVMGGIPLLVCMAQNDPFCELCNKWVEGTLEFTGLENFDNINLLKSELENRNFSTLQALKPCGNESTLFFNVTLSFCTDCQSNCYLSIKKIRKYRDRKNREQTDTDIVIENLILTPDTFNRLRDHFQHITGTGGTVPEE